MTGAIPTSYSFSEPEELIEGSEKRQDSEGMSSEQKVAMLSHSIA